MSTDGIKLNLKSYKRHSKIRNMANDNKLIIWINAELERRGWSMRQLARRAGLSQTQVSNVLNGKRGITYNFCVAISGPLGETPEKLLQMAGKSRLEKPANKPQPDANAMLREMWQAWKTSQATPDAPPVVISGDPATPRLEDIMNIIEQLDHYGLRMVYDFTRWQAEEQNRRRDSSGQRRTSKERQKEEKEVIQLIDLMLAVDEATPTARELFIVYLIKTYVSRWGDCPEELVNILPPLIRQSLPPDLGCSSQSDA
jgi:transcriptional regulator with XRE-family HTH domain